MYLSRMELNLARRGAQKLLANPQAMHAAVLAAFPHGTESRPLWRIDRDRDGVKLYVLSSGRPSFEHLQEQAGWSEQVTWESRDYAGLLARLQVGQRFAFRLVANPSHVVTDAEGRKRRYAHVTISQQTRWLSERADTLGVRFLPPGGVELEGDEGAEAAVTVTERAMIRFPRDGKTVTLGVARFDGLIEVTNVDRLRQALVTGVGRGKAYGCGLLTLAPTQQLTV